MKYFLVSAAIAGGLIAASAPVPAQASTASYSVTIAAKVKYPQVSGDSLVIYRLRRYDTASIHGQVTGAVSGDVVTLLAKRFGAKRFSATGTPVTLTSTSTSYSFTVQPTAETKYQVQVSTGSTIDAKSSVQTLYVAMYGIQRHYHQKCSRTRCTSSYKLYWSVPAAALRAESAKHVYVYVAVGHPKIPNYITLSANAKVSKARRVNAHEYVQTMTYHVRVSIHGNTKWTDTFCTKDTESKDGLGLPGHHYCGDKKITDAEASLYLG